MTATQFARYIGQTVTVFTDGGGRVSGEVVDLSPGHVFIETAHGRVDIDPLYVDRVVA